MKSFGGISKIYCDLDDRVGFGASERTVVDPICLCKLTILRVIEPLFSCPGQGFVQG